MINSINNRNIMSYLEQRKYKLDLKSDELIEMMQNK